jgi:glyceraldehyde-3-phosphate dehydrogenase/erythrose-4-phosphate dehydrogenase
VHKKALEGDNAAVHAEVEVHLSTCCSARESEYSPRSASDHDRHSSIFHMDQTNVMDGNIVRVMSWYGNVWAFSNGMVDTGLPWGG